MVKETVHLFVQLDCNKVKISFFMYNLATSRAVRLSLIKKNDRIIFRTFKPQLTLFLVFIAVNASFDKNNFTRSI